MYTDSHLLQLWWVMSDDDFPADTCWGQKHSIQIQLQIYKNLKEVHIFLKLNDKIFVPMCKFWKILKKFSMIFLGTPINVFFLKKEIKGFGVLWLHGSSWQRVANQSPKDNLLDSNETHIHTNTSTATQTLGVTNDRFSNLLQHVCISGCCSSASFVCFLGLSCIHI